MAHFCDHDDPKKKSLLKWENLNETMVKKPRQEEETQERVMLLRQELEKRNILEFVILRPMSTKYNTNYCHNQLLVESIPDMYEYVWVY